MNIITNRERLKEKFSYVGRIALINVILGTSQAKVLNSLIKLRALWRYRPDGRINNGDVSRFNTSRSFRRSSKKTISRSN